jgi:hypothetical protein
MFVRWLEEVRMLAGARAELGPVARSGSAGG